MMENIVSSIICNEFQRRFKDERRAEEGMVLRLSLSPDYDIEEGYRNLHILLFGFGANYIGVWAKINWTVIRHEWSDGDGLLPGNDYVNGSTPWVLYGYHDSCWRDSVHSIIWEFRDRINCLKTMKSWYDTVPVDTEFAAALRDTIKQRDQGEARPKLADLEFKFSGQVTR